MGSDLEQPGRLRLVRPALRSKGLKVESCKSRRGGTGWGYTHRVPHLEPTISKAVFALQAYRRTGGANQQK